MASMTMSRPVVSSPLADTNSQVSAKRSVQRRNPSFPSSRALRPFPSLGTQPSSLSQKAKPVKLIQPPANHFHTFVLDLTQAEFSRQD